MVMVIDRLLHGEHHRLQRQTFATMAERLPWNVSATPPALLHHPARLISRDQDGATEGFNDKARITTRKAYGFRSDKNAQTPCITRLATYPSLTGSPTDSVETAHY
jgi:hypothetical protein